MKFNDLQVASHKNAKRVGRGISAGGGKTAGRGTKGQGARSGVSLRPGFEGGQNPLMMRIPKLPGFRSTRPKTQEVYTGSLDKLGKKITPHELAEAGIIADAHFSVKVILNGEVKKAHDVSVQHISTSARAAIEKAGGTVTMTARLQKPKQHKTNNS